MDSEEEKPKAFKVDDRRRFSPEGELKPEHRGPDEAAAAASSGSSSAADISAAAGTAAKAAADEVSAAQSRLHAQASAAPEITFGTFVVGLSTQALLLLGEIPDPQNDQSMPDLPAAQQLIDIIGILKEKTRGNLDREEETLLETILFELRMKYVERARQASR